ncbi:MAG: type III pantothenate kinase [Bacteroidota bacterium]
MLLAIDIGNSNTVIGVFDGEKLVAESRTTISPDDTPDETWARIKNLCTNHGIATQSLRGIGISSVVPALTSTFETIARKNLGGEPVTVNAGLDLGIKVLYDNPMTLGADRLCNAVAGYTKYGGPLIVIDFGTATTYDVVSERGDFLGGVIALGVASTAAELHRRTAKLPKIELEFPRRAIAKDTVSAMQAGVLFGAVDAMEGMIRRIKVELGSNATVVAAGGLSALVGRETNIIDHYEPALVLEGVRLIYERVKGMKRI